MFGHFHDILGTRLHEEYDPWKWFSNNSTLGNMRWISSLEVVDHGTKFNWNVRLEVWTKCMARKFIMSYDSCFLELYLAHIGSRKWAD